MLEHQPFLCVSARAMNMEKGAWIFYNDLVKEYAESELGEMIQELGDLEKKHAQTLFKYWKKYSSAPVQESFEEVFERLDGRIMEGGKPISAWAAYLGRNPRFPSSAHPRKDVVICIKGVVAAIPSKIASQRLRPQKHCRAPAANNVLSTITMTIKNGMIELFQAKSPLVPTRKKGLTRSTPPTSQ